MNFIFDEFIDIVSDDKDGKNTVYVAASQIVAIEQMAIDKCAVILATGDFYTVSSPAPVVKHKVDEARNKQARKLDNIISTIRTAIRRV